MDDRVARNQVLVRASHLDKMRDPMQADWNQGGESGTRATQADEELAALIDFGQMDAIFANFLDVTGLPVAIIDLNAKVLASSKWQRICMDYHRVNLDTLTRCLESDVRLSKEMQSGKDIAIYRCHNGLTDCAAPIVVEGRHIANLFIGQFLTDEPDLAFFKQQREQFGFDEKEYLKALAEVPIVSEAKLPAMLNLITGLARHIADLSLARMKAAQARAEVVREVEERTHQLSESEALYRGLFNASGDAVFLHAILPSGEPGRFIQANPVACQRLGYTEAELLALAPKDIDAGGQDAQRLAAVEKLLSGGHALFEMAHIAKDGRRIPVEISARRLELQGKTMVVSVARDITERKRAEAALQRQLDSLRALDEIGASHFETIEEELGNALLIGAKLYGLELGIVSHVVGGSYTVLAQISPPQTLENGQAFSLGSTYCALTLAQDGVLAIPHMAASPHHGHPCYEAFKLEAYIGCPLRVSGEVFGTVNFSSSRPYSRAFDDGDREFIQLLSRWVGTTIERYRSRQRLAASEAHLQAIIDNEPACVKVLSSDGTLLQMNQAGLDMIEVDGVDEANAKGLINFVDPEHRQAFGALGRRVFKGESGTLEFKVHGRQGTSRWLETHATPLRDANGNAIALLGVTRDITEQKHAESQLRLAASVFRHSHEGILLADADNRIVDVNDAFTRITGYTRSEVIGRNPSLLKSGRQGPDFYAGMWAVLQRDGFWQGEVWNRRKDGEIFPELLTISSVRDDQGAVQHYVGVFADITHIKRHQQELEHIAHYDALTNLPNRVLLADRLHQAMSQVSRRGKRLAVAYVDLDGFKRVNDTYGHEIGDQLLITVASRMKQALRDGDTIARLGGDEFVVVAIDLENIQDSTPLLSRLLEATAQPVQVGDLVAQVSASLGVTFYPQEEAVDADQLLRQADQAMYQAKLAGKSRYHVFDAEHDRNVRGHNESLERIRHALDEQEFVLHYQPKVNMRTGQIIGAEALIRWQHPERGLLAPAAFLPVIENHLLAIDTGEWVIETALAQMESWRGAGMALQVSVNIGALQLQQIDFTERLHALLARHPGIDPGELMLEVLETSALEDMEHVSRVMQACNGMGIHFALDDFGTGYSSLTYLKRLPASQLKIDRSFVRDMLDDPEDLAILDGVLGLATAFRRQAIAEGVETVEHGVLLLQLGCELAQGYGIAPPMPAADLPAWIATWRPDPAWRGQRPLVHEDLPLLFAGVEHRACTHAIDECIRGLRKTPVPDHSRCRFGQWLASEGLARYGETTTYLSIVPLHRSWHATATELIGFQTEGDLAMAKRKLRELNTLSRTLSKLLKTLVRASVTY